MRKIFVSSLVLLMLTACGVTRNDLGLEKQSPDEMMVVSRAPLSLPPEFGLRPIVNDTVSVSETPDLSAGEQELLSIIE